MNHGTERGEAAGAYLQMARYIRIYPLIFEVWP
jgi:hypothetical protein